MSKILRRCLSLALAFMLLASLSVKGTLGASADDKTGDGLAAYAMTAYNEGWKYVWGGASYGAVDCSGLIYSYVGGGARVTEDQLYSSPESGYVSQGVPDIPGLGLWQPGHVGVYVGGGMAVDARDEISNVCYQSVSTKSWVMWFKVSGVSYGTDAGVTNDNRLDNTENDVKTEQKAEEKADQTLSFGSTGLEVNKLQERLKALGYFEDNTTEYFGNVTKGALEDFQSVAGLDITGIYDEATKKALEANSAPTKPAPKDEPKEEPEEDSDDVEEEITEAVQSDSDVEADDAQTQSTTLTSDQNAEEKEKSDELIPEESENDFEQEPAQNDDPTDSEQSSANGSQEDGSEEIAYDAVYSVGDEAAEISDIQYILIKLGYFDYNITGIFCDNTADAVEQFRSDYDLGSKRYLDEDSLDALYSIYDGSYTAKVVKAPLYESVLAVEDEDASSDDQSAQTYSDDEGASNEQSVTLTLDQNESGSSAQKVETADAATPAAKSQNDKPASNVKPAEANTANKSKADNTAVKSPKTSDRSDVVFVQTGVEDYFTKTYALILIGISLIVIFFAGTVHYWNVSMEKRRQRARRATTVSVYRRSSM